MVDAALHDKIEQYLLGDLPPEEIARFEAAIEADPVLLEQVEIQRIGLLGLQRMADTDLHDKFSKWDKELDASTPPEDQQRTLGWTTIVLLLLLAAGTLWHFYQLKNIRINQDREKEENARRDSTIRALQFAIQEQDAATEANYSSEVQSTINQLKEELLQKEDALNKAKKDPKSGNRQMAMLFARISEKSKVRGGWANGDSILSAASKAYESEQFSKAVSLLNKIPLDDQRYAQVRQMLPYALFYDGKFRAAEKAFRELKAYATLGDRKAEWFMVLCYLGEGRKAEALKNIGEILKNLEHPFYMEAEVLKKELEGG